MIAYYVILTAKASLGTYKSYTSALLQTKNVPFSLLLQTANSLPHQLQFTEDVRQTNSDLKIYYCEIFSSTNACIGSCDHYWESDWLIKGHVTGATSRTDPCVHSEVHSC